MVNPDLKHDYNRRAGSTDFIVRLSSGDAQFLRGRVEHLSSGQSATFSDVLELLRLIDSKLDSSGGPRRDTERRGFEHPQGNLQGGR